MSLDLDNARARIDEAAGLDALESLDDVQDVFTSAVIEE